MRDRKGLSILENGGWLFLVSFLIVSLILPRAAFSIAPGAGSPRAGQDASAQQNSIDSLNRFSQELYGQQKYDLAISSFRILIQEIDKSPDPMVREKNEETKAQSYLMIADCYIKLGDKNNAKLAFFEFFKLKPNLEEDPLLSEGLGVVYGEAKAEYRLMMEAKQAESKPVLPAQAEQAEIKAEVQPEVKKTEEPPAKVETKEPAREAPPKPKEEPKAAPAPQQKPVVKAKVGDANAGKKKGSSTLLLVGGLAVGGLAALLLLGGGKGSSDNGGPAAPTTGSISVSSSPSGARIYLDNTDKGITTPNTIYDVAVGSHTIRLSKENYRDYQTSAYVSGGQSTPVNATLAKNTISVTRPTQGQRCKIGTQIEIAWTTDTAAAAGRSFVTNPAGMSDAAGRGLGIRAAGGSRVVVRAGGPEERANRGGGESGGAASSTEGTGGILTGPARETRDFVSLRRTGPLQTSGPRTAGSGLPTAALESESVRTFAVSFVRIVLLKGGSYIMEIQGSTANDGSYNWPIDGSYNLDCGDDYTIRVSSTSDSDVKGISGAFRIYSDTGSIKVTSTPSGADVHLDGYDQYQTTPCTLTDVAAGQHIVRVEKSGYVAKEKSVTVRADETETVSFNLAPAGPGKIHITSRPSGAKVYLNNYYQGVTTECWLSGVAAGRYDLKLVLKFYGEYREEDVEVNPGQTTHIDVDLYPYLYEWAGGWGNEGSGTNQFRDPMAVAVDASRAFIYIADSVNNRIQKFNLFGAWQTNWGGLKTPRGIAVSRDGYVYVADTSNDRVKVFGPKGGFVNEWGGTGEGKYQFKNPMAIAVGPSGNVYVADTKNNRIMKYDAQGKYLDQWGRFGAASGNFNYPMGIAVDKEERVYVADNENDRVQKFTSGGGYLTEWGYSGSGDGEFANPVGITVDSEGYVYVVDQANHRVQKFKGDGTYITQWGSYGLGNGDFIDPQGIGIDNDGNAFVSERGQDRIQKFRITNRTDQRSSDVQRKPTLINPLRTAPRLGPERGKLLDRLGIRGVPTKKEGLGEGGIGK